ncbi:PA domain-containing protein [Cryobacterium sp. Hz9]|uniref:PA domain-containing protein n=1 Tax=Cryobacterium sp. Hz9 TaxID=1259167 RepID=UPI001F543119|nr:PA domain-containing protein [Cryobacterium sp. Hz9]
MSPAPQNYETATFTYSGSGDIVGGLVAATNTVVPATPAPSSASGCAATDFLPASATEPQVALIQRGTCTFAIKAANAIAAGYDAVIIFNEGNPGRTELVEGTLGAPVSVPVVGLS